MLKGPRSPLYRVIRNTLLIILVLVMGFSFYVNYVLFNEAEKQKLEVLNQDKLAKYNVDIINKEASMPIKYENVPSYLYAYIDCLNKGLTLEKLSGEIVNQIQRLNLVFNNYDNAIGFAYEDLNTGFSLSIRPNEKTFAASTTKAPLAIYAYRLVDEGILNLNSRYTYTVDYYATGTGIIKNNPVNTTYSLKELLDYSIVYSDNIAYLMLSNIVNKNDVRTYFESKGAKNLYNSSNMSGLYQMFGEITPNDGNVYMKELYSYALKNTANSNSLVNSFKNASLNNIGEATGKPTAHKYGWTSNYVSDIALVFDENPYVLTITTTMGYEDWGSFVKNIASIIQQIHGLYWNNLNETCKGLLR